jgi:hypothetical protein
MLREKKKKMRKQRRAWRSELMGETERRIQDRTTTR